jgi:hypothetical protein
MLNIINNDHCLSRFKFKIGYLIDLCCRFFQLNKKWIVFVVLCNVSSWATAQGNPVNWPWHAVDISFPGGTAADIQRYKANLNINAVRLDLMPRWYALRQGMDGEHALNDALVWTDTMLDTCAALGITAIIHMDQFPLDPADLTDYTSPAFWSNSGELEKIVSVAHQLADRYKKRGKELAAYHFISEPLVYMGGVAMSPAQLPDLQQRIIAEIRGVDKNRWIVVSPGPGGQPQAYQQFVPPIGNNLIWGAHMYQPHAFTHQGINGRPLGVVYPGVANGIYWDKSALRQLIEPLHLFQQNHPAPVFIGEFGAVVWAPGGEQYLQDLASIFNEYVWGWDYFSATDWHGWNPDYDEFYAPDMPPSAWQSHYVGDKSKRWSTLRLMY